MRNAETVLAIVRKRGERGLPLEDVYRMLYNPDLYLRAYGRLYKNKGAMTKGTLPGRTSCCKKSCAPSWKRTTNRR